MRQPKAKKITQVLPSVRFMPKLSVSKELAAELIDIVDQALARGGKGISGFDPAGRDIVPSIFAPEKAQQAAEFYVSAKQYETPLPDFRKTVDRKKKGSIAFVADQLLKLLQSENEPPFAQMRALFCSADPTVDGLDGPGEQQDTPEEAEEPEGDDQPYDDDADEPEGIWRTKYSPEVLKDILTQWLQLLDDVHKSAGGGPSAPGRSPIDAEINFVSWLAAYWQNELGLPLSSGRGTPADANNHDQQGLFADFVRKAAEIIPIEMIPKERRPASWEHAIRENLPKKT
jgi:hypothetical protein